MNGNIILLLLLVILIIIVIYYFNKPSNNQVSYIKSDLNNKEYLVQNLEDKDDAANTLGIVENRINFLRNYFEENMDNYPEYKQYLEQFCNRIKNLSLHENDLDSKYTSYTVNKGDTIALCLRSKKNGEIHDINLIMYVVLHELAHVACPEVDHTELFKKIFIFFIKIAVMLDIYENKNYQINPHEYCGIIISENLLKH